MAEDRNALHAYLSERSHGGWQQLAEGAGVSTTGLLEVVGLALADIIGAGEDPDDIWPAAVKAARRVDAGRRRRGPANGQGQVDVSKVVDQIARMGAG